MRRCKLRGNGRQPKHFIVSMPLGQASRAPMRRGFAGVASGRRAIVGSPKQSHQNTPLTLTALPIDTVTVTDPIHPLYGLTFPLIGVTTKQRLGRVCVVWLYPGVERVIPVTATDLADHTPPLPSRCRLSITGIDALLAVVASQADLSQEDAYGTTAHPDHAETSATVAPVARTGAGPLLCAARTTTPPARGRMDQSLPHDAGPGAPHASADYPGGAA